MSGTKLEKVINVVSHKGGVGKTSLALALGQHAAQVSKLKTVIVDVDFHGTDLREALRLSTLKSSHNLTHYLADYPGKDRAVPFPAIAHGTGIVNLNVITSQTDPRSLNRLRALIFTEEQLGILAHTLAEGLKELASKGYQVAILDHAPGFSGLQQSISALPLPAKNRFDGGAAAGALV